MQLKEISEKLNLKPLTNFEDRDVQGVFIADMMTDLMTNAQAGNLWLTIQTHKTIISAANLVDISAIVITHGKTVPEETLELANRYNVVILSTELSTFQLVGKLIEIGLTT